MKVDYETLQAMDIYGGSFIKALAECYKRADYENAKILRNAFRHYFDKYAKMAKQLGADK